MAVTPPQVVVDTFLAPVTQHTRRVEVYESDGITRWGDDDTVRLKGGSVSVDYSRAERRALDLTLDNSEGDIITGPGEFWYDKIIKVFRGAVVNETGYQPKIAIIGDKPDSLSATGLVSATFRTTLSAVGFTNVTIRPLATSYAQVSEYDIFVFLGDSTAGQLTIALNAYNAGKSIFLQGSDAMSWIQSNLTGVTSVTSASGFVQPVASTHPVSKGWGQFPNTTVSYLNLCSNPSMETQAYTKEIWRNLVTNPSMETATGTIEVRRNLAYDPRATSLPGIDGKGMVTQRWYGGGSNAGSTTLVSSGGPVGGATSFKRKTWTAVTPASVQDVAFSLVTGGGTLGLPVTPGQVWTFSYFYRTSWVANGSSNSIYVQFYNSAGTNISTTGDTSRPFPAANTWTRIDRTFTVPASAAFMQVWHDFYSETSAPSVGSTLDGTGLLAELSPVLGSYFDGATTSPDTDLTRAWVGTADASASTLTGPVVTGTGYSSTVGIPFQSSQWSASGVGSKSMRIVATSTSNDSFVDLVGMVPFTASLQGKTMTISGKVRLTASQTGALIPDARRFRISIASATPNPTVTYTSLSTNAAGIYLVTATFVVPSDATGWNFFRLYNGASAGNGDVWWDEIMLVEGIYTGGYFDGAVRPKLRRNAFPEPNFPSGGGWGSPVPGAATLTFETSDPHTPGLRYLRETITTAAVGHARIDGYQQTKITGVTTMSVWVRASSSFDFSMNVVANPLVGGAYDLVQSPYITLAANVWTRITFTFTSPGDTNWLSFRYIWLNAGNTLGFKCDISEILVENAATAGTWFDGAHATAPYSAAWEGTADSSASYIYDQDLTPSWVGTVNASASLLQGQAITIFDNQLQAKTYQSTRWKDTGTKSLLIVSDGTGTDSASANSLFGGVTTSGKSFTFTGVVHLEAALTGTLSPFALTLRVNGAIASSGTIIQAATNAPGTYTVRQQFDFAPGGGVSSVYLYNGAITAGQEVWWDSITLIEGPYTGPYFDGSTVDTNKEYAHAWTGTANASTSTRVTASTREYVSTDPTWKPIAKGIADPTKALGSAIENTSTKGRAVALTFYAGVTRYSDAEFVRLVTSSMNWLTTYTPVTIWETQIGEFMIDRITDSSFPHEVKITGRDYTKKCLTSKFAYATQFATGLSMESIIGTIAANAGITKRNLPATGVVVNRAFFYERGVDRWTAMKEIADAYNYELYFDPYGYLTMRAFNDPALSSPTIVIHPGEDGQLSKWDKSTSDSRMYNHVIVTGESSDATVLPASGEATNTDPLSPTSVAKIGDRLYQFVSSFIRTDVQAQAVADNFLAIHSLEEFEISYETLMLPWLEVGDIVGFTDSVDDANNGGDPSTFLLSSLTIPLELGPMSSVGKRVTIVG